MKERYPWVRKGIRVLAGITLLATGFMALILCAAGSLIILIINIVQLVRRRGQEELG